MDVVDQHAADIRARFSLRLDLRMTYLRLGNAELADKLGVSRQAVCKWRTGDTVPTVDKIPALAEFLQCEIADLFVDGEW